MTDYWFKPKSYGYGATPINWKGWASTVVLVVALLAVLRRFVLPIAGGASHSIWDVGVGLALALAVVVVFSVFAKTKTNGEWHWRWGEDAENR